jgi:hypothetical protein
MEKGLSGSAVRWSGPVPSDRFDFRPVASTARKAKSLLCRSTRLRFLVKLSPKRLLLRAVVPAIVLCSTRAASAPALARLARGTGAANGRLERLCRTRRLCRKQQSYRLRRINEELAKAARFCLKRRQIFARTALGRAVARRGVFHRIADTCTAFSAQRRRRMRLAATLTRPGKLHRRSEVVQLCAGRERVRRGSFENC